MLPMDRQVRISTAWWDRYVCVWKRGERKGYTLDAEEKEEKKEQLQSFDGGGRGKKKGESVMGQAPNQRACRRSLNAENASRI